MSAIQRHVYGAVGDGAVAEVEDNVCRVVMAWPGNCQTYSPGREFIKTKAAVRSRYDEAAAAGDLCPGDRSVFAG